MLFGVKWGQPIGVVAIVALFVLVSSGAGIFLGTMFRNEMQQLLGAKCAAVYTPHASIGADVDKPIDVVVSERVLYQRVSGSISSDVS